MTTAAGTTTSTIGQMVTGIDTDAIIKSLVAAAQVPEDAVKAKATTATNQLNAYQDLNTSLAALQVLTSGVSSATGWGARSATSTNTAVATVTAKDNAPVGALTFTVDHLASAHSLVSQSSIAAGTTTIASGGSIGLTVGGTAKTLSVGNGTLDEVVSAINTSGLGITATQVNTGTGYRLQVNRQIILSARFLIQGLSMMQVRCVLQ